MLILITGFIQGSLSKIQGLFQGLLKTIVQFSRTKKFRKNSDRSVKIPLQKC